MRFKHYNSEEKIASRARNARFFRGLTKQLRIEPPYTYWSLSGLQPPNTRCEILQLIRERLIEENQYHGVDLDKEVIEQNETWYPKAHWYSEDWIDAIEKPEFKYARLVNLDTMKTVASDNVAGLIVNTMMLCSPGCILLVNVALNHTYSNKTYQQKTLLENINAEIPDKEMDMWNREWNGKIPSYRYRNKKSRTTMIVFVFWKDGNNGLSY